MKVLSSHGKKGFAKSYLGITISPFKGAVFLAIKNSGIYDNPVPAPGMEYSASCGWDLW